MGNLRRYVATSSSRPAQLARSVHRGIHNVSIPAPRVVFRPLLLTYLAARSVVWFIRRVFIAEPLFKAMCTQYGKNLHTDIQIHNVAGKGDLILGDNVLIDGKCGFAFAARFSERPTLTIGDNTGIGTGCGISVAKRVTIGRNCRISMAVVIFDSSGHPSDPAGRLADLPPDPDDVRPVTIGDNVWIGLRSMIFPGVTIGEGSVVAAGSVVMSDVPPNTVVAGNPARKIATLKPADAPAGDVAAPALAGADA